MAMRTNPAPSSSLRCAASGSTCIGPPPVPPLGRARPTAVPEVVSAVVADDPPQATPAQASQRDGAGNLLRGPG